jgi:DNA invertase Pin-like site-specific DNA recombinase
MNINVYLRASTAEQNAERARETINTFLNGYNLTANSEYIENVSGAQLNRPQLMRMIEESQAGDVIIIEQIDRLSRLVAEEWEQLKRIIADKGLLIVSLDLPTSWMILTGITSTDIATAGILKAINSLLMDILAITARKDYEDRRRRQAEGIQQAQAQGKYQGKQANPETELKCKQAAEFIEKMGLSKQAAAKAAGVGIATFYRYLKTTYI